MLTRAFSPHTPNVALELGPVNDAAAPRRAYEFLRKLLGLERIPEAASGGARLFRTLARVHLRDGVRFAFANQASNESPADSPHQEPARQTVLAPASGRLGGQLARARQEAAGQTALAPSGDSNGVELVLDDAIEASNFARLPAGTLFGVTAGSQPLEVLDNGHRNVTGRFFDVRGGRIVLKSPVVPAMYTTDPNVVRQDCLCYFMEPLDANDTAPRGTGC